LSAPINPASSPWQTPQATPQWKEPEVHLWRASLTEPESRLAALKNLLTDDERSRGERFVFADDRNRFICARGILRLILGRYLGRDPSEIRFLYGSHGKPAVAGQNPSRLSFNLSHSRELALYALAQGREVGVDVEYMKEDRATDAIAERFFSPQEVVALRSLPAAERRRAFFNCWTRKEAYIKGRGQGLSLSLQQFDVSVVPGEPAALLAARDLGNPRTELWALRDVPVEHPYAAAVAVEGPDDWQLSYWQWPKPEGEDQGRQMPGLVS
jgi:4'-phosphopantetheinyl transferase